MEIELALRNWGPIIAGALIAIVAVMIIVNLVRSSAGGQLRASVRVLRKATRERERANTRVSRSEHRLRTLTARSGSVKPRLIDEAKGALTDSVALAKIADDRWMIAANNVRRVILEEFPPRRHEQLRRRYLPAAGPDGER